MSSKENLVSQSDVAQQSNVASFDEAKIARLYAFNKATYGDIIKRNRIAVNLSQPKLAEILNTRRTYVSNWENGKARPDLNIIPALCDALHITLDTFFGRPDTVERLPEDELKLLRDYRYLSFKSREILRMNAESMMDIEARTLRAYCENNFEQVFHVDLTVSAGTGALLDEGKKGAFEFLRSNHTTAHADAIITISGDSMEPIYNNGQHLLVEYTSEIEYGEIGVFVADGEGFVKEYREDGLHPHNPDYPVLNPNDFTEIRCVGRVLGLIEDEYYPTEAERIELEDIMQEKKLKRRR